jgi:hypothetical protein
MKARVELPLAAKGSKVFCNGKPVTAEQSAGRWVLQLEGQEVVKLEVK